MNDKIHMSLKGHFLIAMPGLLDPNFSRSVVCICEHTGEGSLGLVVNRAYPTLLSKDIFEELGIDYLPEKADIPIFFGGPVHMDELFILHGPPFDWGPSVIIVPSLAMSNNRAILEAIALGKGPDAFQITLGCSGWGPDQMESEMMENAWLSTPLSRDVIFDFDVDARWEAAVRKLGIDPARLTDAAGHA
ncbi:YqgE/AlgH family protein [Desulfococcus sp.]|uniref:YqgE/AlgH family protein n=1 Tax=Desulfococcus sp. TaxID=2025834 RepID=UPI0035937451